MSRRVRAGISGGALVSGLQTISTRITSANNLDITIDPVGTGRFLVDATAQIQNQNSLRFATAGSANWVAFRGPASASSNLTWTLPNADGSNNQVLTTDGAGNLLWTTAAVTVTDNTSDSNINYPLFTTATTGTITAARVTSSRLDFQPSTGRLRLLGTVASTSTTTVTFIVSGGVGIAGQMTADSIVETSSITLKENILPIENALENIIKLSGVTYDRLDNQQHEAGLIAEWVEEVFPDLVTRDQNNLVVGIKYTKLTAYLIEAVKSLKVEIDNLKGIGHVRT